MVYLRACNSILAAIEKKYYVPGLHVDFSKKGTATQLNGQLVVGGLQGMLEAQSYKNMDMTTSVLAGFIDRCTEGVKETSLTKVNVLYSVLMLSMTKGEDSEG